jgi:diguanylate cyclase (GGDEF)-like protein/PAS domain S-box-containing protein
VRLLRNLARAQTQLGQKAQADVSLQRAQVLGGRFDDPKLSADVLYGVARLAYAEREFELRRLKDEAARSGEREAELARSGRASRWLSVASGALLLLLASYYLQQRRANQQTQQTLSLLRESEAKAQDLLNLSAGYVFLHDVRGRLLLVNPAAAQALGMPAMALVGRSLADFQPRRSRADFDAYLERLRRHGHDEGTLLMRAADGSHKHWRYSSRLTTPVDGRAHVVGNAVDVTAQVRETRELHEQSVRDALTGSYNRRHLDAFESAQREQGWAAIGIDLDHFKQVNDQQGHDQGDQVLIEFSRFLDRRAGAGDAVVRLGGDEFALLLAGADVQRLEAVVEGLRRGVERAPCAFSMGAALREGGETLAATLARADGQMYSVRGATRTNVTA